MSIDWQTDETIDWDALDVADDGDGLYQEGESILPTEPEPKEGARRGWWRWVVIVVVLLAGLGWGVTQQLNRRVDNVGEQILADVIPSHVIIYESATAGDVDLFASFLSGRDKTWSDGQQRAVLAGMLTSWPQLGLVRVARDPETAVVNTHISPDLGTVEVVSAWAYRYDIGNGLTDVVTMTQTAVYRQGETKWLLAPPEADFWGEMVTRRGRFVTLTFPERDAALANELAIMLEEVVADVCANIAGVSCPDNLQVAIDLTIDPIALANLKNDFPLSPEVTSIQLPTPSLLAIPQDEAGEAALLRGYSNQVAATLITNLVAWRCCEHRLFYEALLMEQQRQLGLRPSPYLTEYYQMVSQSGTGLADAEGYWSQTAVSATVGIPNAVLAVVDFVLQTTGAPPTMLQQSLIGQTDYEAWLRQWLGERYPETADRERGWLAFAQRQAGPLVSSMALPDQDLQLICHPSWGEQVALYRYDLESQVATLERVLNGVSAFLYPLPISNAVGVSVVGSLGDNIESEVILWQDSSVAFSVTNLPVIGRFPQWSDPTGRYLLLRAFESTVNDFSVLDVAFCQSNHSCDSRSVPNWPVWSFDGERMLFVNATQQLFLADGSGQNEVVVATEAAAPFWLDEMGYGYARNVENGATWLVERHRLTDDFELETLFDLADVMAELPEEKQGRVREVEWIVQRQAALWLVLLVDLPEDDASRYVLAYDLEDGSVMPLVTDDELLLEPFTLKQFSPNGRYFAYPKFEEGAPVGVVIVDLENRVAEPFLLPSDVVEVGDWSADGDWMVLANEDGTLSLVGAAVQERRRIVVDDLICSGVVWS